MSAARPCPQCGSDLPDDLLEGLCPRCVVRFSLEPSCDAPPPAGPFGTAISNLPPGAQPPRLRYFGDYELLEEIARGGMGVVYKARQISLNRIVAVKMILAGQLASDADVKRFRAEAEAAANLKHSNIVAIHEVGEHEGQHYFSMDFIEGQSLATLVREGPLPAQRAARYVQIIAEAIHYAHQCGTLHRDLKPSNVLIDTHDQPQVTDFGLAKRIGESRDEGRRSRDSDAPDGSGSRLSAFDSRLDLTLTGQILGSPNYMPPEQASSSHGKVGPHSDIYSLGALLYHLLTARPPFAAESIHETLMQLLETEPAPPRLLNPGVPRDLETICLKCLQKVPSSRYASAQDFADDLGRFRRHEPIRARPIGRRERTVKWVRRRPRIAALLAAVFVAVTAGMAGIAWQWRKAVDARNGEEYQRKQAEANAVAATKAKGEAEQEARRRLAALTEMQIQRAEDFFAADDSARGVAHLASVLTSDPSNRVAAERLLSALTYRNFSLPLFEPLRHDTNVSSATLSTDGLRVVTASRDKTARVWDAQTGKPLTEPLRHEGTVNSAQFSPGGLWVVTASSDKTARVWDAQTGKPLTEPLRHETNVSSAKFSPDGLRVVTASADKTARVWDTQTGKSLTEPVRHESEIWSVQFSPDGLRVVTASGKSAWVWDAETGKLITEPLRHNGPVASAQFSPDGLRVVTASWNNTARVWDAETGKPLTEPLRHERLVHSAQFSPDGLRVVTASDDKTARVWDAQTGKPLTEPLRHESAAYFAQFSPDGLRVVTSFGTKARVWDAQTGMPLTQPIPHEGEFRPAQFGLDGLRVFIAARVWDAQTGKPFTEPLRHEGTVHFAQFSPDGLRVITASDDETARVWDAQTGKPLTEPLRHESTVYFAHFSPDGLRVVTSSFSKARVWDAQTGMPLTQPIPHDGWINSAHFSPDGLRVASASGNSARIWDAQTVKPLTEPLRHEGDVLSAQFSADGLRVITASRDKTARVWNSQTGKPLSEPLRHESTVPFAQFSPDGLRVVTTSDDKTARVWDAQSGKPLTEPLRHEAGVSSAQFSPDGLRVVTASYDKTARVWDTQTGKPLTEPLRHDAVVRSAQFSSDGLRVVTASSDKTARVWDAQNGKPLSEPLRHEGSVHSAQFSPDGQRVVTASADNTARVWEMTFGSAPAPPWLPELAVMVAGKRLTGSSVLEAVSADEFVKYREQLAMTSATDYYTRWARWFCADRATRTISPLSSITVPEYVGRCLEENTTESLREAVFLSPTNGLAFARLARKLLPGDPVLNPREEAEAHWFSQRALQLAPNDAEVWLTRAKFLDQARQPDEALKAIVRTIELNPQNPMNWIFNGELLAKANRFEEGDKAFSKAIELAVPRDESFQEIRLSALLGRSKVRKVLNRLDEAQADFLVANNIPPRDPQAKSNLIDLSSYYNAGLSESWHQGADKRDLVPLPRSIQTLGGVEFDVRGLIQAGSASRSGEKYLKQVNGIEVSRACRRLHFLHAAIEAGGLTNGTQVGRYVIHLADDREREMPLQVGRDLADWWTQRAETNTTFVVAWTGTNDQSQRTGNKIRLFKSTWENPQPDVVVRSIDFQATHKKAAPFLVAITAEP